jgi:hypothetical protein
MESKAEQQTTTFEIAEHVDARVARLLDLALPQTTASEVQDTAIAQFNQVERNPYEAVMERYGTLDETVQQFITQNLEAGEPLESILKNLQDAGLNEAQGGCMPESYAGGVDVEQQRQRKQFETFIRELINDGKTDDEIQQTLGFGNYTPPPKAKQ